MWKIEIFERTKDGNRGKLKTTSQYPTKLEAVNAQATLRNLARGWTIGIGYGDRPTPSYKMNNVIVADPVEIQC